MDLLRRALRVCRERPACLATVVRTRGSTPRHPGAKMLIFDDGTSFGTIGGGRVELEVTRAGAEVAAGGAARRVTHHLVRDLAMCCGGSMELYLEPLAPCEAALDRVVRAAAERRAVLLVTDLAGGGKDVRDVESDLVRGPRLEGDTFFEPLWPTERAFLFGAGHVSQALGPVLAGLGFEVIMCDDNETGAIDDDVPWARSVASFDLVDIERELGPLGPRDYALVLTRDHAIDQQILEALLPHPRLGYLGLIGSRGKIGRFRKRIEAKGPVDAHAWQRLHAPIGLDIAAETPGEIAVSIAAELVAHRRGRRAGTESEP